MTTPPSRRQRRRTPHQSQQQRRKQLQEQRLRQHAELHAPIDYSQDYAFIRHDLRRLTLWSAVLFAGMIALSFVL
ncbi:MAG: hypothetical protein HC911_15435 [Chloroflexaceae bacterium]|nr:hypothetical protein [Chloroflexaceae bacterium]